MKTYIYKGLPLTPKIAEELIIRLFNNQTIKRETIISKVEDEHKKLGGIESEAEIISTIKKALSRLRQKNWATNIIVSAGYWKIHCPENSLDEEFTIPNLNSGTVEFYEFGHGSKAVYLYTYPTYIKQATIENKGIWPCKIGKTRTSSKVRVINQSGTAMAEMPTLVFSIKTENPNALEAAIHKILELRGRALPEAVGKEWFNTNPNEVIDIVKWIDPSLLKVKNN